MTLPASGTISMSQVNVELGLSATATISLNDTAVRNLFGVASGQISLSDGYGKTNTFNATVSSNQTNLDLRTYAVNAGWNEADILVVTINSGVVISGNTQANSTAALTVSGSFPNGVTLVNNGVIVGRGGNGGAGGLAQAALIANPGSPGSAGGRALSVSSAISINNAGTIAGGGGGGGGGAGGYTSGKLRIYHGGGGGGGGRSSNTNSSGGAGGSALNPGNPGTAGTYSAAGTGGATSHPPAGNGGNGGGWGSAGSAGVNGNQVSGGAGGAAGQAVSGNSNITWVATGTRLGPIV